MPGIIFKSNWLSGWLIPEVIEEIKRTSRKLRKRKRKDNEIKNILFKYLLAEIIDMED